VEASIDCLLCPEILRGPRKRAQLVAKSAEKLLD